MHMTTFRFLQAALLHLLGAWIAVGPAAVAQMRAETIPDSVLRPYAFRDTRAIPGPAVPAPTASAPASSTAWQLRDYSVLGGAVQVEAAREGIDGLYTRPKIIIGLPSDSMKSWMNSAGFVTEQCLLPMLRARAGVNADGEPNGALWLYARCTFH